MGLLGFLLTLVTFPGVIVHELAHEKVCDRYGIPVLEVCYFRFGNPAGYVIHAEPARYRHAVLVGVAPFLLNTALAVAAFGAFAVASPGGGAMASPVGGALDDAGAASVLCVWLGASFAIHAFPSTGDASALWKQTKSRWRRSPSVLLGLPVIALLYLVNALQILWLDVVYAIALFLLVTTLVPSLPA